MAARARDVAVGLAVVAARTGTTAVRIVTLPARVVVRSPAAAPFRGPAESLAASGREAEFHARKRLESAAEGILDGPLPEASARALVEHDVARRVAAEVLASVDVETVAAEALDSEATDRIVERVLASPAFERRLGQVVEAVLTSPEVRAALTRQTTGLAEQLVYTARNRSADADDSAERFAHHPIRRTPREPVPYAGIVSRAIGLVVDAALAQLIFFVGAGIVALVAGLAGSLRPHWLFATIAASAWAIVVATYFVAFWSMGGQTPGMQLLGLRVAGPSGRPPGVVRSFVRLVGLVLAIVPLFLGFVPVLFDRRRRGLQDYLAGTTVLYDDRRAEDVETAPAELAVPRLT
jgi:uncharacterized RDD family membrane protein YckC